MDPVWGLMRAEQVGFMRELGLGGVGQAERPGWFFFKRVEAGSRTRGFLTKKHRYGNRYGYGYDIATRYFLKN